MYRAVQERARGGRKRGWIPAGAGGFGVHSAGEGVRGSCAEAACARRAGTWRAREPVGRVQRRCWGHAWVAHVCRGVRTLLRAEGSCRREDGAALGRLTPWWSPGAEAVTGSSTDGTRQAMGV